MQVIPITYLAYMFIALYMFFFFLMIYIRNRKDLFSYPKAEKEYSLSIVTPAYNEEDSIEGTIRAVLASDYPIFEMIVVNDNSKDKTGEIVERLMKKFKNLRLINNAENLGKAGSLNRGIKLARGELIAVVDSDSYPEKDAIRKMIGFFNDKKTGAVTCSVLVKHKNKFIEKLQNFEYVMIAWTRRLLGYIDGIWATPGPLSIYRRNLLKKLGGFDANNLTEDIEITWKITSNGYLAKMCLASRVYSIAPKKFSIWVKQRIRWDIGGLQCVNKYRGLFFKRGMFGFFILPFFIISMFLGLLGIGFFSYLALSRIWQAFFYTQYTYAAGTSLIAASDIYVTPTVLNFFGIALFILGLFFTLAGFGVMGEKRGGIRNIFNILYYMLVYLTVYPLILLLAIGKMVYYKILGKKLGWGTK